MCGDTNRLSDQNQSDDCAHKIQSGYGSSFFCGHVTCLHPASRLSSRLSAEILYESKRKQVAVPALFRYNTPFRNQMSFGDGRHQRPPSCGVFFCYARENLDFPVLNLPCSRLMATCENVLAKSIFQSYE